MRDGLCECGSPYFAIDPIQPTVGPVKGHPMLVGFMTCASCAKHFVYAPGAEGKSRVYPAGSMAAKKLIREIEDQTIEDMKP